MRKWVRPEGQQYRVTLYVLPFVNRLESAFRLPLSEVRLPVSRARPTHPSLPGSPAAETGRGWQEAGACPACLSLDQQWLIRDHLQAWQTREIYSRE